MAGASGKPGRDCPLCPRLHALRHEWRCREPQWFNAPVPSFGSPTARLLIVGLAPGLKGANRTGRPFTGDYAGDLLYETLKRFGFTSGTYAARPDDGLTLIDARITNAVRCVPPEIKPLPAEIRTCRWFLAATIAEMPSLRASGAVRPWRTAGSGRVTRIRELSLLALQHEYGRAYHSDVPCRVRPGARLSRRVQPGNHLLGALVRREYRIEDLGNDAGIDHQHHALE